LFIKQATKHLELPQDGNATIARIATADKDTPKQLLSLLSPPPKMMSSPTEEINNAIGQKKRLSLPPRMTNTRPLLASSRRHCR